MKVLYVDDSKSDLVFFGIAAERAEGVGIWLQTSMDGKEAIEVLEGIGQYSDRSMYPIPEVVVLDWKMPVLSGEDFLLWHRSSEFYRLPVVMLSDSIDPEERRRASELGASAFLQKPFSLQDWEDVVTRIFGMGVRHRQLAQA